MLELDIRIYETLKNIEGFENNFGKRNCKISLRCFFFKDDLALYENYERISKRSSTNRMMRTKM